MLLTLQFVTILLSQEKYKVFQNTISILDSKDYFIKPLDGIDSVIGENEILKEKEQLKCIIINYEKQYKLQILQSINSLHGLEYINLINESKSWCEINNIKNGGLFKDWLD